MVYGVRWAKFSPDGIEIYCFVGDEECVRASQGDCMHVCIGGCVCVAGFCPKFC